MRALAIFLASAVPFLSSGVSGEEPSSLTPPTPEASRAMFERFKGLSGTWDGKSTRGWEETLKYEVIAGGSTVLETSGFTFRQPTVIHANTIKGNGMDESG